MVICNCRVAASYYRSKARKGCADCCYCCCCWLKHCCCNTGKGKGSWETHGFLIDLIFKDHQKRVQTVDANFCSIFPENNLKVYKKMIQGMEPHVSHVPIPPLQPTNGYNGTVTKSDPGSCLFLSQSVGYCLCLLLWSKDSHSWTATVTGHKLH